ncbi:MAG: glycosyl hydrolase 53 family protein [Thermodesulfobacteriota bacterium]
MKTNFLILDITKILKDSLILMLLGTFALSQMTCGGGSKGNNTIGKAPYPPDELSAKPGNGEVLIKWREVNNAISYNVYFSTLPNISKTSGTKISNVRSPFYHTGLKNNTTYYYFVTAANNYGESVESKVINATPLASIINKYIGATINDYLAKKVWDVWKDFSPLPILHKNGFGWARVWVRNTSSNDLRNTPPSNWNTLPWKEEYWSSLEYAEKILKESSQEGMRLNLVFLLSDKPAYSFNQPAPPEWDGLNLDESADALEEYCYNTTKYFKDKGLNIEIYDIGNEIEYGILNFLPGQRVYLPPGIDVITDMDWMKNNIWNLEAVLLKAAIRGVKRADPNAKITLHINTLGLRPENYIVKSFFRAMVDYGVEFDYAGLSFPYFNYYDFPQPYFDSSQWKEVIDYISSLGKKIIISEFTYPHSSNGITGIPDPAYPFTPEGQAKWIKDFLAFFRNNQNIAAIFYFYPDYFPGMSRGSTPEHESSGLFINETQIMPAMLEFNLD